MLAKEAYQNAGNDLKYFPYTDNEMNKYSLTNTDWTDVFYDTANTFQTNLSLMGGARNTAYYLSASYLENTATVKGNNNSVFLFVLIWILLFFESLRSRLILLLLIM